MKNTIDNHDERLKKIQRDDTVRKNRDKLVRQDEKGRIYRKTVPVVVVVSVGLSIYSFKMGRKSGYLDGVKEGYVKAGHELVASWREHSEQLRLSRQN